MNIILFGPPGAGKGTQADNIVKFFNLHRVSTGDLLRDEVQKNSDLGSKIKSLMDEGSFAPDGIINDLIVKMKHLCYVTSLALLHCMLCEKMS